MADCVHIAEELLPISKKKSFMSHPGSLDAIASRPPDIPEPVIAGHLSAQYGLQGELTSLISERDQNFRLRTTGGDSYVVKIANVAETEHVTKFQVSALLHLEERGCPVAVPRAVRSADGNSLTSLVYNGTTFRLRVVTWVDGQPIEGYVPGAELAWSLGQSLAGIDMALSDFEHEGQGQSLLWDMQRAMDLRQLVHHIHNEELSRAVDVALDDFEEIALPAFGQLRQQVIHNDLNPGNVLVAATDPTRVAGVIDFGDMLRAPLVVDVAIAIAYLRSFEEDFLAPIASFLSGFHSVLPLEDAEVGLLHDLLRARLVTTITILHWRAAARGSEDEYLQKALAERSSERFLERVNALSRSEFLDRVSAALRR